MSIAVDLGRKATKQIPHQPLFFRVMLPLPADVPHHFSALPEFYVEDIADFFLFILQ